MRKPGEKDRTANIAVFTAIVCISIWIVGGVSGSLNNSTHLVTGSETLITTTRISSDQENPVIYQDRIVWQGRNPLYFTVDIILYNITSGKEIVITPDTLDTDQMYPSISGNIIVWEDGRNGFSDIYLYNCTNQKIVLITPNTTDSDQLHPGINGNRIVWQDNRNGSWDIYLYDLLTGNETRITNGSGENEFPDVSGSWIVWQDTDSANMTSDIMAYNIDTGMTRNLISDTQRPNHEFPVIWGENVVCQDFDTINGTYDVFLGNITSGVIQIITPDATTSDQKYPRIENDRIIWQDNRNGVWNLILYDLKTGTSSILTNGTSDQTRPAVSGNRVVWQDERTGVKQIYLLTLGVSSTYPVADFTANTTFGLLPLSVSFTDQSTGEPTHWSWDFGDGSSSDGRNATHTYTNPGIYPVTLTVNTPYFRDSKRVEQLITAGSSPSAQFSLNQTEGVAPLVVECTDESSGEPTEWTWDFGDGTNSTDQNPVHEFGPGIYTIRLNASNPFGNTVIEKPDILLVLNGTKGEISWNISGIEILDEGEGQRIAVNTTQAPVTFFNETLLVVSGPAQGKIQSVRFFSGNSSLFEKTTNSTIAGNISGMAIGSEPLGPAGEVLFDLTMPYYYPDASIQSIFWENITPLDLEAAKQAWFSVTYGDVTGGAYTVQFLKMGINHTGPAKIRMAVNSSWVKTQETLYGTEIQSDPAGASVYVDGIYRGETPISIAGPTAGTHQLVVAKTGYLDAEQPIFLGGIRIIRIGDDGASEVLPTTYLYTDPATNLDYFEADSPNGLSKFTIAGLSYAGNPFQLFTLFWTSHFGNSGGSGRSSGGGGGGGGSSVTSSTVMPTQTPLITAIDTPIASSVKELLTVSITPASQSVPEEPHTTGTLEAPPTSTAVQPPAPNFVKTPLGIISGMILWIGELTRGRFIFIFAAVAITVVSVIAIWKRGYIGRE